MAFKHGDLVFAKMRGYPPWPAMVEEPKPGGKYLVFFFGTSQVATVKPQVLYPYEENKTAMAKRPRIRFFQEALQEIEQMKNGTFKYPEDETLYSYRSYYSYSKEDLVISPSPKARNFSEDAAVAKAYPEFGLKLGYIRLPKLTPDEFSKYASNVKKTGKQNVGNAVRVKREGQPTEKRRRKRKEKRLAFARDIFKQNMGSYSLGQSPKGIMKEINKLKGKGRPKGLSWKTPLTQTQEFSFDIEDFSSDTHGDGTQVTAVGLVSPDAKLNPATYAVKTKIQDETVENTVTGSTDIAGVNGLITGVSYRPEDPASPATVVDAKKKRGWPKGKKRNMACVPSAPSEKKKGGWPKGKRRKVVSVPSVLNVPTVPTVPTAPNVPNVPTVPSEKKKGGWPKGKKRKVVSVPSVLNMPTVPTVPTGPSVPNVPTELNVPSVPNAPSEKKKGGWPKGKKRKVVSAPIVKKRVGWPKGKKRKPWLWLKSQKQGLELSKRKLHQPQNSEIDASNAGAQTQLGPPEQIYCDNIINGRPENMANETGRAEDGTQFQNGLDWRFTVVKEEPIDSETYFPVCEADAPEYDPLAVDDSADDNSTEGCYCPSSSQNSSSCLCCIPERRDLCKVSPIAEYIRHIVAERRLVPTASHGAVAPAAGRSAWNAQVNHLEKYAQDHGLLESPTTTAGPSATVTSGALGVATARQTMDCCVNGSSPEPQPSMDHDGLDVPAAEYAPNTYQAEGDFTNIQNDDGCQLPVISSVCSAASPEYIDMMKEFHNSKKKPKKTRNENKIDIEFSMLPSEAMEVSPEQPLQTAAAGSSAKNKNNDSILFVTVPWMSEKGPKLATDSESLCHPGISVSQQRLSVIVCHPNVPSANYHSGEDFRSLFCSKCFSKPNEANEDTKEKDVNQSCQLCLHKEQLTSHCGAVVPKSKMRYGCSLCRRLFVSREAFEKHKPVISGLIWVMLVPNWEYSCKLCGEIFEDIESVANHCCGTLCSPMI